LEIPNLGSRSNQYIGYLVQRYAIRNEEAEFALADAGEGRWLVLYGVASFFYRVFITLQIALFIAGKFFFVGIVIAIWAVIGLMVVPLVRITRTVMNNRALYRRRGRIIGLVAVAAVVVGVLVGAVRLPSFTVAEGVLWPAEQARIHARVDGEVKELLAKPGAHVKQGDPILRCENPISSPGCTPSRRKCGASGPASGWPSSRTGRWSGWSRKRSPALRRSWRRPGNSWPPWSSGAPSTGRSCSPGPTTCPAASSGAGGRRLRGRLLRVAVRIVVPQSEADRVRTDVRAVQARPAENVARVIPSELVREVPAATGDLPSFALSLKGGGPLPSIRARRSGRGPSRSSSISRCA
jgi:putative peptide zinc metalloprotease protein